MNLEELRREYLQDGLRRSNLNSDPFKQFELWMSQAIKANISDPTAMSLATVSASGQPSQRLVLLKNVDEQGFVFYSNYKSQKAVDLERNPKVSLLFPWHILERQIRIEGCVEKVSAEESAAYFHSRPRDSQLGAWASAQSAVIENRETLLNEFNAIKRRFENSEIPLPDFWGGYRVVPTAFEFWQGGESRLHDRFRYEWCNKAWQISRLAP